MSWRLITGDCVEAMRELEESSIDCVVTDPPYGIGFMGHEWDQPGEHGPVTERDEAERQGGKVRRSQPQPASGNGHARDRRANRDGVKFGGALGKDHTTGRERGGAMHAGRYDLSPTANRRFQAWTEAWAIEALRVLKPGGHLVSFASTRTNHCHVSGLEDAGFEIRDSLAWLFGGGFPKSLNLSGEHEGWGTALRPAHEPITLARRPFATTVAANVAAYGTGALHIDAARIPVGDEDYARNHSGDRGHAGTRAMEDRGATDLRMGGGSAHDAGRWPANVVLDETAAELVDEQSGVLTSGANPTRRSSDKFRDTYGEFKGQEECVPARGQDVGGASRFFYCAKASRKERDEGLQHLTAAALRKDSHDLGSLHPRDMPLVRNQHPTVKPVELMRWLVRLVAPPGGIVLDPFTGSGTTGIAAALEDRDFIGIEREPEYVAIAEARIRYWTPQGFQLTIGDAA